MIDLIMFIPNLIFGLVSGIFKILFSVLAIPFHLVFGLVRILLTPFVAIYMFLSPGQMVTDVAVASTPPVQQYVAKQDSKIKKKKAEIKLVEYYAPEDFEKNYDKIMAMKGFRKPLDFTVYDDYESNPLTIDDDGDEIVLTKLDLEKGKTYTFNGQLEEDYRCGYLRMAILDNKGNGLVESESLNDPLVMFKPRKSDTYTLVTNVTSHYDDASCYAEIDEYIK